MNWYFGASHLYTIQDPYCKPFILALENSYTLHFKSINDMKTTSNCILHIYIFVFVHIAYYQGSCNNILNFHNTINSKKFIDDKYYHKILRNTDIKQWAEFSNSCERPCVAPAEFSELATPSWGNARALLPADEFTLLHPSPLSSSLASDPSSEPSEPSSDPSP